MDKFTFDEIRNFKVGDVFWTVSDKFVVSNSPVYKNISRFYGDFSEKLEWTAISETTKGEVSFQVTNTKDENNPQNPIIFKSETPTQMSAGAGQSIR